jgi:hypothetical protein
VVLKYRSSRCLATWERRVLALAFDLKPFRALGRFSEGSKSDV